MIAFIRTPTMREVAAVAGVSIKTVSRVVNAEGTVSATLVARVTAAIDQLNYRPNEAARTLRQSGSQSAAIGAISSGTSKSSRKQLESMAPVP